MSTGKFNQSVSHWIGRGFVGGFIFIAAINAVSYLFRSSSLDHLFDGRAYSGGAIGFPLEIWRNGVSYSNGPIDNLNFCINLAVAILVGAAFAFVTYLFVPRFNQWVDEFESEFEAREKTKTPTQFSIKSMMMATTLIAILAAGTTHWRGTRELLWFVYLLGPLTLLGIAFMPRGASWQARCVLLSFAAMIVIGGAMWSGTYRGLEFDRVLMGIFIFWTPQGAFSALALVAGYLFQRFRASPSTSLSLIHI